MQVPVFKTPNKKFDLPPTPNKSIMLLQDDPVLNQECNLMLSVVNNDNDDKVSKLNSALFFDMSV